MWNIWCTLIRQFRKEYVPAGYTATIIGNFYLTIVDYSIRVSYQLYIQYMLLVIYHFNVAASVCMLSSLEGNIAMLLVANITAQQPMLILQNLF